MTLLSPVTSSPELHHSRSYVIMTIPPSKTFTQSQARDQYKSPSARSLWVLHSLSNQRYSSSLLYLHYAINLGNEYYLILFLLISLRNRIAAWHHRDIWHGTRTKNKIENVEEKKTRRLQVARRNRRLGLALFFFFTTKRGEGGRKKSGRLFQR